METSKLRDLTVSAFMAETASSSPAPGGGSIAALGAASAAALIAMVAHLTVGKEAYASVQDEMADIAAKATAMKDRFVEFIDEDTAAFTKIMDAFKLPKGTDEEKALRTAAIQFATKDAAEVPYNIGELANELLPLAEAVILRGNTNAVTDGAVAAMNARTAVHSAFLNVKINLGSIKDEAFVAALAEKMSRIEADLDMREQAVMAQVKL